MAKPGATGVRRIELATRYSMQGLKACWHNEAAFREEVLVVLILVPFAFMLGDNATQIAVLLGACMLVLIVELLNSAIEAVVDRVGTEQHELAGRAKDIGSAAVMLSIALAVLTWGLVLVY